MRADFDDLLTCEAQSAGVSLCTECAVLDVNQDPDTVTLRTNRGALRARYVIAADGADSVVGRKLCWPDSRALIPALECEVSVDRDTFSRLRSTVRFDFGVVPRGYAWVFPKREHLSIGVLTMRRGHVRLYDWLKTYLKILKINRIKSIDRHGFVIPIRPRKGPLGRGRILLVGDAAGFVDPITAEGITFAIRSGQIAATALCDGLLDPEHVNDIYHTRIGQAIIPELRAGAFLARLVYDHPKLRNLLFRLHGQKLTELMTDIVVGERSYVSILSRPANYLKLLRFWSTRAPGAGES